MKNWRRSSVPIATFQVLSSYIWLGATDWLVREWNISILAENSAGWHCSTPVLSLAICGEALVTFFPFNFIFNPFHMDTFASYNKNKLLRERCEQWSLRRQNKMAAALELVTDSLPPVGYEPRTPTPAPAWLQRLMSLNNRFFFGGGEAD